VCSNKIKRGKKMRKNTKWLFLGLVALLIGAQVPAFARGSFSFSFGVSSGGFCRPTYWHPAPVYYAPYAPCIVRPCCPPQTVVVVPEVREVRTVREVREVPVVQRQCSPTIRDIFDDGELLRLNDDTLWGVSPAGQHTSRLWRKNETVAVERSGQYSYPYALRNLQTGETVAAALKQAR
jgi:hypothetical protein